VRCVSVVGDSGSGKSTLGRELAARLAVPYVELDAIFHQPGWTPLPEEEFRRRVTAIVSGARWVIDGNYSAVRPLVWERADTVIWLDPPRSTVMRRIIWRTIRRAAGRTELWNGNRERWRNLFSFDKESSVIAWAWQTHAARHEEIAAFLDHPPRGDLRLVHVASVAQERQLREGLGGTDAHVGHDATSRSAARWTSA
jgi:adenylate kinase family enzyme